MIHLTCCYHCGLAKPTQLQAENTHFVSIFHSTNISNSWCGTNLIQAPMGCCQNWAYFSKSHRHSGLPRLKSHSHKRVTGTHYKVTSTSAVALQDIITSVLCLPHSDTCDVTLSRPFVYNNSLVYKDKLFFTSFCYPVCYLKFHVFRGTTQM